MLVTLKRKKKSNKNGKPEVSHTAPRLWACPTALTNQAFSFKPKRRLRPQLIRPHASVGEIT